MANKWSDGVKRQVGLLVLDGKSDTEISKILGIPRSTIFDMRHDVDLIQSVMDQTSIGYDSENEDADKEVYLMNDVLARKVQLLQDTNRVERKGFREQSRCVNAIETLGYAMRDLLRQHNLTIQSTAHPVAPEQKAVGVIQLSDLHFNEIIRGVHGNTFDFEIASKRIQKHIQKSKRMFAAHGVDQVALFLTGDLLNSDRRLDEVVNMATNRSRAMFLAVDILQQAILDLNEDFNVTVASITGNESRVGEFVQWDALLASDSYDIAIHNMLAYLFLDKPGINFLSVDNPLEKVVDVNGVNFLLVHGHGHKGLARTSNLEGEVQKIKARYAGMGVRIDYVLAGHIHQAFVSDMFSRSSGLPGSNAYSQQALNLDGKASQNAFIVFDDGTIDGFKNDLQSTAGYAGYPFETVLESYHKKAPQGTVVIQSVIV